MAMTRPLRGDKEVGGRGGSTFVKAKDPFHMLFTPTKLSHLNSKIEYVLVKTVNIQVCVCACEILRYNSQENPGPR